MSDFQTNLYSLAIHRLYSKYPKGCRYNIIRNPQSKPHKGESLKDFTQRLSQKVQSDPNHYFLRYRIYQPKQELIEFEKELNLILQDFIQWQSGTLPTYKNRTACINRYGACSMLPICYQNDFSGHYKREKLFSELGTNKKEK